jgi:aminocarboxymuconate-semialdehyde decarboxylase
MRGIEIMTHVAGEDLSAERFRKVFRRIEELGLLVFMHPDGFTEAWRLKDHYFANVIGNPLDTTVALHHLIFGGVLEDCPGLKLVAAHGGGYLPAYAGRIDHAASARPDTGEKLKEMPGTYLRRLFAGIYASAVGVPRRAVWRRSYPGRHRLSGGYGRDRPGGLHRRRAWVG